MSIESAQEPLAPTVEAIDEWLAREARQGYGEHKPGEPSYGVNVKSKSGRWRCISGPSCKVEEHGHIWYWTIRGEGKSSEGRDIAIRADRITQAEGWIVGDNIAHLVPNGKSRK
jgi:hypothetical protein